MSYILDALRRADAERERGEVPGLRSQQQHDALEDDDARPRMNWMLVAVVVLALALAAALGWNLMRGSDPPPAAAAPMPPATATAAPAVRPATIAAAPATIEPPPLPSLPAAVPPVPMATVPPLATAMPAPTVARPPAPRRAAASAPAATLTTSTAAAPVAAASPAARGGPESRVFALAELPDDIKREMPKVAIGGASYSSDAASRMVIINGQVFHEGDKVASGLVLEKIKLKAAVLAYKGWRYQVDY